MQISLSLPTKRITKLRILHCVGNRPQYMKLAPLIWESPKSVDNYIVNTGQHYDAEMSSDFLEEFNIPFPNWTLMPPKHDLGLQFLIMMQGIDNLLKNETFNYVFVYGDTNTTLAATISAHKNGIPIVHVESGLRSRDFNIPEERNRIIVDSYSSLKFTPTLNALLNLTKENLQNGSYFVGDLMFDLFEITNKLIRDTPLSEEYILCTIHRKSNLEEYRIKQILEILNSSRIKVKVMLHPALKATLRNVGNISLGKNVEEIYPQSYMKTLTLLKNARGVITDSGGLQKEAYWMGKPTLIPRSSTEWRETTDEGLHKLDYNLHEINTFTERKNLKNTNSGQFGNGHSAKEIWSIVLNH